PLRLRAREALAAMQMGAGRAGQAEAVARRALALAHQFTWTSGVYRLHALLADALAARGSKAQAAAHYRESAAALAAVRERLGPAQRDGFETLPVVRAVLARAAARPAPVVPAVRN
ncbi:MAG: hypothetical protein ACRD26_20435, partial [Vicinamibacterales bacterium]